MTQTNLDPQTKEIISRLYSSNEYNKKEAIYRILFDRRIDLIPELKKAVKYEKNESIAVFMVQVCLTLTSFPRDSAMERRILEILQYEEGNKVNDLTPTMWKYLETCATSQMIIAILASMGNSIPSNSYDFIEMCLTHPDPEVRALVCEKAIRSGRPSHFAYVLSLVVDKDPLVSQTAFLAIKNLPENELSIILDYALGSPDEWVLNTVAPFLPNLITNSLRPVIAKVQYHSNSNVAHKAREALKVLDAIPYVSKRSLENHEEEKNKLEDNPNNNELSNEKDKKISLREQLEQKRKEQEEKERIEREANEALDKELSLTDSSEMEEFEKNINNYDSVFPVEEKVSIENLNELPEEKEFTENTDFSLEASALADIDGNAPNEAISDLLLEDEKQKQKREDEKAFFDAINSFKKKEDNIKTENIVEDNIKAEIKFNDEIVNETILKEEKTNEEFNNNINNEIKEPITPNTIANKKIVEEQITNNDSDKILENQEQINNNVPNEIKLVNQTNLDNSINENNLTEPETTPDDDILNTTSDQSQILNFDFYENNEPQLDSNNNNQDNLEFDNTILDQSTATTDNNREDTSLDNISFDNVNQFLDADSLDLTELNSFDNSNSSKEATDSQLSFEDTTKDVDNIKIDNIEDVKDLDLTVVDLNSVSNDSNKKTKTTHELKQETNSQPNNEIKPQKEDSLHSAPTNKTNIEKKSSQTKISIPSNAKEIFDKYPSFLVDPLIEVFKATNNADKLKAIEKVLNNLTAFLNICFLQSSMYYAQESEMLTKSIKDCIKGNLIGPSAIRCLHNFVLAMKAVRGNNVFFTFPLAKTMSSSLDTNPLMLMRELKEFLREPEEPLDESIPQAEEGLLEILRGVRAITNNTLIMKAPKGAKLPYADLSGPTAKSLASDKRPSMDLPVGEIILISSDGAEALGLYPFFKYSKKKIIFTIPTNDELKIFYERLEIIP